MNFHRHLVILFASALAGFAQTPLETARSHLEKNAVYREDLPEFAAFMDPIEERLKQGRDAETKTMSFVHGIRRHAKNLLTDAQSERWNQLLDSRADEIKRLHDERNVLRGFFFAKAWQLPVISPSKQRRFMTDLQSWLEVWLDSTMHERVAHHRLFRDAFRILTPEQQRRLSAGEWDRFVRKSTGHKRAYFGDRIVVKALGEPSDPVRFKINSDHLAQEQAKIRKKLLAVESRWRKLTLQIPAVSDQLLVAEWYRTADALGSFFMNQVTNIHVLCRAGYELADPVARDKIAEQSERELALLSERVRANLTAGAKLHAALVIAREQTQAAKNPPLPSAIEEACRQFRRQPAANRIKQLDQLLPLVTQNGATPMYSELKPELSVERILRLLGRATWVRTFSGNRLPILAHTYSCGTNATGRQVEIMVVDADAGVIMRTENSMLSTSEQVKYPNQIVPRLKPHLARIVTFAKADQSRVGRVELGAGWSPVSIDNFVELEQTGKEPIVFVPMRIGRGNSAVGYLYHAGLPNDGQPRMVELPTGAVQVSQSFGQGWHWAGRNE